MSKDTRRGGGVRAAHQKSKVELLFALVDFLPCAFPPEFSGKASPKYLMVIIHLVQDVFTTKSTSLDLTT